MTKNSAGIPNSLQGEGERASIDQWRGEFLRNRLKPVFVLLVDQSHAPNRGNPVNGEDDSSSCRSCNSQKLGHKPLDRMRKREKGRVSRVHQDWREGIIQYQNSVHEEEEEEEEEWPMS